MNAKSIILGATLALSISLSSTIHCAASQFSSVEFVDYRSSLSQESAQIHELWRADIEQSSTMRVVKQRLLRRRPSERNKLVFLKMLDGLLDSVRRGDPAVVMGTPDVEGETTFRMAWDEANTLVQTYRDYVVLSAKLKEQPVKTRDLEPTGATNISVLNSTREHLLRLVGEQALSRLDSQLHQHAE